MEQLELFESEPVAETYEPHEVDYIFIKEGDKYRLNHSFYRDSRVGSLLTAEEVLDCIKTHNVWHHYSAVCIQEPGFLDIFLKKRVH